MADAHIARELKEREEEEADGLSNVLREIELSRIEELGRATRVKEKMQQALLMDATKTEEERHRQSPLKTPSKVLNSSSDSDSSSSGSSTSVSLSESDPDEYKTPRGQVAEKRPMSKCTNDNTGAQSVSCSEIAWGKGHEELQELLAATKASKTSTTRAKHLCIDISTLMDENGVLDLVLLAKCIEGSKEMQTTLNVTNTKEFNTNLNHLIAILQGVRVQSTFLTSEDAEELTSMYEGFEKEVNNKQIRSASQDDSVQPLQWGDGDDEQDEQLHDESTRIWMLTKEGRAELDAGRIQFYSGAHKSANTHRQFHQQALKALTQSGAEEILGQDVYTKVISQVENAMGINGETVHVDNDDHQPALAIQWNIGHGYYMFHMDEPGDPNPEKLAQEGGGGGFGRTIANVTLRQGATIFLKINKPGSNRVMLSICFHVDIGSMWGLQGAALYAASHAVLPDELHRDAHTPDCKCRISMNIRFGLMTNEHMQRY